MRKLNNKGFAISTVLYSLLVMATLILFLLIGNLSFERRTTNDLANEIKDELNDYVTSSNTEVQEGQYIRVYDNYGNVTGYATYSDGTYIRQTDTVRVVSRINNGYSIDVHNNSNSNETNIKLYQNNTSGAQYFKFTESTASNNYYNVFKANATNMVWDTYYNRSTANTNIQLYTLNNGNRQLFQLIETNEDGYYYIRSALGTCVDAYGGVAQNEVNIDAYFCNSTNAQKWKLIKI